MGPHLMGRPPKFVHGFIDLPRPVRGSTSGDPAIPRVALARTALVARFHEVI